MPKTLIESYKHVVNFDILFIVGNPGKISKGKNLSKGKSELLHLGNERS